MMEKIQLTINGQLVEAEPGTTILQAARQHNIHIPTLCYNDVLRPLERCRLCVVKVEGEPHLQASCSTQIREGMVVATHSDEIQEIRKLVLQLLLKEHYGDCVAPCHLACPAGVDIQGYLALIAQGQYLEALQLIRERVPMPLTIGRVCPHFCEYKCNRNLIEEPININHLKRFVADYEMQSGKRNPPPLAPLSGKRVAIIGGGPAGLSAAHYLRRLGHGSTIFEAMPELGGMLRYGIPEYRLPKKILDWEIDGILNLGNIEVKLGVKWGEDFTLDSLRKEGYHAFFVGIGAWSTRKLGIVGEDLNGVLSGVDFLVDLALGKPPEIGRRVAIIGGGNVAIDAARNSVRMGAEEVTIIYRRSRSEMPASPEEIHGAEEEGVKFHFLAAPVRLFGSNGRVSKLEYVRMELGEPDASGRRRPVPVEGSETVIPVDMVIAAIGQFPNLSALEADKGAEGIPTTRWNTIGADPDSMYANIEGVFSGGDVYRGPETVVGALADGRKAALAIHVYLQENRTRGLPRPFNILKGDLEKIEREQFSQVRSEPRQRMPELPANERITNYAQIELGLSEENASREAERCLSCGCLDVFDCRLRRFAYEHGLETTVRIHPQIPFGEVRQQDTNEFITLDPNKCIRCKQCHEACTYFQCSDAIDFEDTPNFNPRCVFCGLCVDMCPTGALEERIQGKPGPFHFEQVDSFCAHCGCGCNLILNLKGDRLYTVTTRASAPPSYGHTCRMGRFDSFDYLSNPSRLQTPLVRKNGKLVETGWQEALDRVAAEFKRLKEGSGPEALAAVGSPCATNEANYLLQKAFRIRLGTNNLDCPTGQSQQNTMIGLSRSLGIGAMTNSLSKIEQAEVILALGNDIENSSPIVATSMRRASRTHGKRLITASSTELGLASFAEPALVINHGRELEFLQAIGHLLLAQSLADQEFVNSHTSGFQALEKALAEVNPDRTAELVGIPRSSLEEVARAVAGAPSLAVVYSEDLALDPHGLKKVEALVNLALLAGVPGKPDSGIYPLYRHINAQGALDMGISPVSYPGHARIGQPEGLSSSRGLRQDDLPSTPGVGFRKMIAGAEDGTIKGMYIMGENPVATEPEREKIQAALSKLEFLVVQDMFLSQTGKLAHVVLPATAFLEQEGTLTNIERRVQRLTAPLPAPGNARADWQIVAEFLARLDGAESYPDARSVYQEIIKAVPFYAELSYEGLDAGGRQWPGAGELSLEMLKKPVEFNV